jgi:hypothetical protein
VSPRSPWIVEKTEKFSVLAPWPRRDLAIAAGWAAADAAKTVAPSCATVATPLGGTHSRQLRQRRRGRLDGHRNRIGPPTARRGLRKESIDVKSGALVARMLVLGLGDFVP